MQTAKRIIPVAVVVIALFAIWQLYAGGSGPGDDVLPPPSKVFSAGWDDRSSLWANLLPTLSEVAIGFCLSLVGAFLLAVALDSSAQARRSLMPVLIGSQTLPIIILAPLAVIWFGFGLMPKVLLVALVTFFPLVVGLLDGFASSGRDATTLMRTMGASRWTELRLLRLPSALPSFFTGLRISITYAVVAAIFAEYAGAEKGLGIYMQTAKSSFRTDLVLAAVLLTASVTLILYGLTFAAQRMVMPWWFAERRVTGR